MSLEMDNIKWTTSKLNDVTIDIKLFRDKLNRQLTPDERGRLKYNIDELASMVALLRDDVQRIDESHIKKERRFFRRK